MPYTAFPVDYAERWSIKPPKKAEPKTDKEKNDE